MKILIDGQTLNTPELNRGIGTYVKNTVENMLAFDFVNDFYIDVDSANGLDHFSPWAQQKLSVIPQPKGRSSSAVEYSEFTNDAIKKAGIDLYWSPNALMTNVFLPTPEATDCHFVATIFDVIPAVMKKQYQKAWPAKVFEEYQNKLELLERDYDLLIHISERTKSDFIRTVRASQKRHVVTPLAAAPAFRPYPFPEIPGGRDYILYPGGFDPRKNMDRAVEAFAEMHKRYADDKSIGAIRLLIICQTHSSEAREMMNRAKTLGLADKLELCGFVSDLDLITLYQKARCLFFPSLYEGFGLPVLEGLACGIPVAASNTSSIPEVAGNLATYFDPLDVVDMASSLYQTLKAPVDLESRMLRHEYSKRFSWQSTAVLTLQTFADCAQGLMESNASWAVTNE
ncbi:MAG TPA: glycosyltransferase family 1 protein [Pyrinomonadaceae bacterium]|jgi:glycosyltransferase involved in cell wall biosynthesis|nr:glycosyltransferase family 1 protein [Pyrinomonadaceae bacterium]